MMSRMTGALLRMASSLVRQACLNARWPLPRAAAHRCCAGCCGWDQPVRLLPTKARGMGDGERINEGRFPHPRSRVALAVEVGLHHRSRLTREAPRRPSDDRVAFHQPYQDRHTGRTRAYGAPSCTSSTFPVHHAGAERVKRFPAMDPRVRRREPETLCREAFSSQAMAVLHDSDTRLTTSLPRRTGPNAKITSVCAGHRLGGAPRRNRTGDPILTMEPPGTAVRDAVSPGHARP
jgi:hypothetical protein